MKAICTGTIVSIDDRLSGVFDIKFDYHFNATIAPAIVIKSSVNSQNKARVELLTSSGIVIIVRIHANLLRIVSHEDVR